MPKLKLTQKEIKFLALIAYKHGEISIGRCRELTKLSRADILDECWKTVGVCLPENNVDEIQLHHDNHK